MEVPSSPASDVCRPFTVRHVRKDDPTEDEEANRRRHLDVQRKIELQSEQVKKEYHRTLRIYQKGGWCKPIVYDFDPEEWSWWKDPEQGFHWRHLNVAAMNNNTNLHKLLRGPNALLDKLEDQNEIVPIYWLMEYESDLMTIRDIKPICFPYRIDPVHRRNPDSRLFHLIKAWFNLMRALDPWYHRNEYIHAGCLKICSSAFVVSKEQATVDLPVDWHVNREYDTDAEYDTDSESDESMLIDGTDSDSDESMLIDDTGSPLTDSVETPPDPISTDLKNDVAYGKIPNRWLRDLLSENPDGGQWLSSNDGYITYGPRKTTDK